MDSGGEINVAVSNGLAGATGTTPVTLNGGVLATFDGLSVHLGNVTSAGGLLYSYPTTDPNTGAVISNTGAFTFGSGAELHATAVPTLPVSTTETSVQSSFVTFEAGSDVRADNNTEVDISANLVDDANGVGQLTVNGTGNGTVVLFGTSNAYNGSTTVNSGTLVTFFSTTTSASGAPLYIPSQITNSKTITVASGAEFINQGILASQPNVTANGVVLFATYPGQTAAEVTTIASLSIGGSAAGTQATNGQVVLYPSTTALPREVLVTGSLAFAGTTNAWFGRLNVGNNDLDVQNGNLATITNQIATGYNTGTFTGNGIYSSIAAANTARNTTVGVALNNTGTGTRLFGSGTAAGLLDGTNPALTDVLVRYTYYGDANLDGRVDGSDYARIDAGFLSKGTLTGWYNGDFNYDGKVDASDYTLIDNAFNTQSTALTASALSAGGTAGNVVAAPWAIGRAVAPRPLNDAGINGIGQLEPGGPGLVATSTDEIAPVSATAAVPEPATATVLAVGGTALLAGRRRRRSA